MIRRLYLQWSIAFAVIIVHVSLLTVFTLPLGDSAHIRCVPWLLAAAVTLALCYFLRDRGVSVLFYVLFSAALAAVCGIAGQTFLVLPAGAQDIEGLRVFLFLMLAGSSVHCSVMAAREVKQFENVICFDLMLGLAALILFVLFCEGKPARSPLLMWTIACGFCNMLSLSLYRLHPDAAKDTSPGDALRTLSPVLLAGAVLLAAIPAALNLTAAADLFVRFVSLIRDGLIALLTAIVFVIMRLWQLLLSVLPAAEPAQYETPDYQEILEGITAAERAPSSAARVVFFIMIAALLLSLTVVILMQLRGLRLRGWGNHTASRYTGRRGHFSDGILRLLKRLRAALRFELAFAANRRSAPGLFLYTRRKLNVGVFRMRRAESPSAYLHRLSGLLGNAPCADVYEVLSLLLERRYYAKDAQPLPDGFYDLYRNTLRRDLRRAGLSRYDFIHLKKR